MANYQPTKPAAIDQLNDSQDDIQKNFEAIKDLIDVNHETFAGGAGDEGKHKYVTMPEQGVDVTSAPQTLANETAIYCRLNDAATASALFFRPEGQGAGAGTEYDFTSATKAASGYTMLPSGLIIKWGTGNVGANAAGIAVYEATVGFTTVYSANATLNGTAGMDKALFIQTLGLNSITVYNANANGGNRTFYYFVIGV